MSFLPLWSTLGDHVFPWFLPCPLGPVFLCRGHKFPWNTFENYSLSPLSRYMSSFDSLESESTPYALFPRCTASSWLHSLPLPQPSPWVSFWLFLDPESVVQVSIPRDFHVYHASRTLLRQGIRIFFSGNVCFVIGSTFNMIDSCSFYKLNILMEESSTSEVTFSTISSHLCLAN